MAIATWLVTTLIAQNSTLEPLDPGPVSGVAVLASDPVEGRYGYWVMAQTEDGALLFDIDQSGGLGRGDTVSFEGMRRGDPGRRGVHEYRARVSVTSITLVSASSSPPLRLGDALRNRVMSRLEPFDAGRGLVAQTLEHVHLGTDEDDPLLLARAGEIDYRGSVEPAVRSAHR
ncbi:MAG: hypothetical protein IH918_06455 [Acidobacteria bacterium]|nr:hypothetical protein [Acidobacteriota bacterium]